MNIELNENISLTVIMDITFEVSCKADIPSVKKL